MTATDLDDLAKQLHRAYLDHRPIAPLSERFPDLSADDAYEIQRHVLEHLQGPDDPIVGYKIGLTSRPMRELLGVDEPDYSGLLAHMRVGSGSSVPCSDLIQPKVEAEIAVVMDAPIEGPGVTANDVRDAAAGIAASIEIIDSRIEGWRIRLVDTVADLGSTARFVLSDTVVPLDGIDPRLIGCLVELDGETVASGAGAAALGDPLEAAAWAVNTLSRYDVTVRAGHVILTGSVHAALDVEAGREVSAVFDRLGSVSVSFS